MTMPGAGFPDRSGPERLSGFRAATPWTAASAIIAAFGIVLIAIGVAGGIGVLIISAAKRMAPYGEMSPAQFMSQTNAMAAMVAMQAVIVGLVVWLAGWHGGERRAVLSLRPALSSRLFFFGLAGMALLLLPYNLAIYTLWPDDFTKDLRPFSEMARSPGAWLAGLVVTIGAPFSEELLFRGFLLPALALAGARTFVGIALGLLLVQILLPVFGLLWSTIAAGRLSTMPLVFGLTMLLLAVAALAWGWRHLGSRRPGQTETNSPAAPASPNSSMSVDPLSFLLASLFSTAAWTLMHMGYSITGLAEVFMIGLFFCWLMWRFGNLWLTIALHAFYNGLQFVILTQVALPAPA